MTSRIRITTTETNPGSLSTRTSFGSRHSHFRFHLNSFLSTFYIALRNGVTGPVAFSNSSVRMVLVTLKEVYKTFLFFDVECGREPSLSPSCGKDQLVPNVGDRGQIESLLVSCIGFNNVK